MNYLRWNSIYDIGPCPVQIFLSNLWIDAFNRLFEPSLDQLRNKIKIVSGVSTGPGFTCFQSMIDGPLIIENLDSDWNFRKISWFCKNKKVLISHRKQCLDSVRICARWYVQVRLTWLPEFMSTGVNSNYAEISHWSLITLH